MTILKIILTVILIVFGNWQLYGLSILVSPVAKDARVDNGRNFLRESLIYLGCPRQRLLSVQSGIETATDKTGVGGVLLASLLYTESNFRISATSSKGYKGIAQTPQATMIYAEVDILHGAMILKDKLRLVNGNMEEALMLYKGGRNSMARQQARQVIKVYNDVARKIGMV